MENNANDKTCPAPPRDAWAFSCKKPNTTARFFIEIENHEGQYQARIHQGEAHKRHVTQTHLKLGPGDTVNIKGKDIPLSHLIQGIINFDSQWLKTLFDERGQYELGLHLYTQIFGEVKPSDIRPENGEAEIRIITEDEHIARLPWMLLAHHGIFLSTTEWSVALSDSASVKDYELPPSPKMLIIAPQPQGVEDTKAEPHLKELEELLSPADSRYTLSPDDTKEAHLQVVTTWETFREKLPVFQPDILYYYGHGVGDRYSSRLVFAAENNAREDKPAADLLPLLRDMPKPPLLAYMNCCYGDAGGFLGMGRQLGSLIPAVVTNRTVAMITAARAQGLAFWKNVLLKEMPPHKAVSHIRSHPHESDLTLGDIRWMTPVLHCRYNQWTSSPHRPPSRLERDPHWRLKLDRVSQFAQVFYQTSQMIMERKPRALGYLWYGAKDQGLDIFHNRLRFELQEKLNNVVLNEVMAEWPTDMADPHQSFTDMLNQAFQTNHIEQIAARIRTCTRSVSGQQTLVYIRHRPVRSAYIFHPKHIRTYLEWWDLNFVPRLPEQTYALLGISYEVKKPSEFQKLLTEKERLDELELTRTVFQLLDELDKISRKDLLDFLKTHNIQLPPDIKDGVLDKILDRSRGSYERVLDELKELEREAWRLRKEAEEKVEEENGGDEYEDIF
ncbi:hypothetical protein QUF80_01555 [Desulfococcaceae bacterium HSG8]|nr:hypothetical protein [Desulfococcaceae bacterium HSG8]